jgi:hypothetical protein
VVALQRSISVGAKVTDSQTGNWLYQYGKHLHRTGRRANNDKNPPYAKRFIFNPLGEYNGPNISFNQMTAWILGSAEGSQMRLCAEDWDDAIIAMYEYQAAVSKGEAVSDERVQGWKQRVNQVRELYAVSVQGWKVDYTVDNEEDKALIHDDQSCRSDTSSEL